MKTWSTKESVFSAHRAKCGRFILHFSTFFSFGMSYFLQKPKERSAILRVLHHFIETNENKLKKQKKKKNFTNLIKCLFLIGQLLVCYIKQGWPFHFEILFYLHLVNKKYKMHDFNFFFLKITYQICIKPGRENGKNINVRIGGYYTGMSFIF